MHTYHKKWRRYIKIRIPANKYTIRAELYKPPPPDCRECIKEKTNKQQTLDRTVNTNT